MAKTLFDLVQEYLAQPLQDNFEYENTPTTPPPATGGPNIPGVPIPKAPIIYVSPNDGDGGDGGINSLDPYGGTPIEGGFDGGYGADPISGDLPGGGNIVDEFGIDGNVYAGTNINNIGTSGDLPGGGNLYDEFVYGGFSGTGPGVNTTTGDLVGGGNIVDEFGIDGNVYGGFSGAGSGVNTTTGDLVGGGNIVDEFGTDGNTGVGGGDGGFSGAGPGVDSTTGDIAGGGNIVDEFGSGNGGSGGGGGGGTHCCTAANERGDMTLLEVKKLRVWHRKQSKIWQRGYDVWGRVMADNLVSKYKWSSDRVRDFYNHKIYGKRTIGSTFADLCIYPMSMVIGCILTVMPPILGYQENKKNG